MERALQCVSSLRMRAECTKLHFRYHTTQQNLTRTYDELCVDRNADRTTGAGRQLTTELPQRTTAQESPVDVTSDESYGLTVSEYSHNGRERDTVAPPSADVSDETFTTKGLIRDNKYETESALL